MSILKWIHPLTVTCVIAAGLLCPPAHAATILYRTDAELVAAAERIVHGRVLRQRTERPVPGGAIYTVTTIAVLEELTGRVDDPVIDVWELGGAYGGEMMLVGGAVHFTVGGEVVVFLERGPRGLRSVAMGFSKFDALPLGSDDAFLVRSMRQTEVIGGVLPLRERTLREFRALALEIHGVPSRRNAAAAALQPEPSVTGQYTIALFGNGLGARWTEADSGVAVNWYKNTAANPPLISGDAVPEIRSSLAAWTDPTTASIVLSYAGNTNQSNPKGPWTTIPDGNGVISFEDPNDEISGSTLAIGGGFAQFGNGGTVNGTSFNKFTRGFVIFQNAANLSTSYRQSLDFSRVLEHEIGHAIGLGHTQTDGSIANATANIMYPSCCWPDTPVPPALGPDDLAGLVFIYPAPSTPVCTYSVSPASRSVDAGASTATISVTAPASCTWTAVSDVPWLTVTSGASGSGNGTVTYAVSANTVTSPRSGAISVRTARHAVTQAAFVPPPPSINDAPGRPVLIWHNTVSGALEAWRMHGTMLDTAFALAPSANTEPGANLSATGDFNRDGHRDLLWQNLETNEISIWLMNGAARTAVVSLGTVDPGWQVAGAGDMNYDAHVDIVFQQQTTGFLLAYVMNGTSVTTVASLSPGHVRDTNWKIVAIADMNNDTALDLVWQHLSGGWMYISFMDGFTQADSDYLSPMQLADPNWRIVGVTDEDADGRRDDLILQHRTARRLITWRMQRRTLLSSIGISPDARSAGWRLPGARYLDPHEWPDIDGDGYTDLLVRDTVNGQLTAWLMQGINRRARLQLPTVSDPAWQVVALADFNFDRSPDIIWQHVDGYLVAWTLHGGRVISAVWVDPAQEPDSNWRVVGAYDADRDGNSDLLWQHRNGQMRVWYMNGFTRRSSAAFVRDRTHDPAWRVAGVGDVNGDGRDDIVWWHSIDGNVGAWYMNDRTVTDEANFVDPARQPMRMLSWRPVGVGDFNGDGMPDVVWQNVEPSSAYFRWGQIWYMRGGTLIDSVYMNPASTGDGRITGVR